MHGKVWNAVKVRKYILLWSRKSYRKNQTLQNCYNSFLFIFNIVQIYNNVLIDLHVGHSIIGVPFISIDDHYFF